MVADPHPDITKLTQPFGSPRVVASVHLKLSSGRVLGMVGENGAGKSTLLNIVSGIWPPDSGSMHLYHREFRPAGYPEALSAGVSRVFQEQALIPNIRVYENLLLS